MIDVAEPSDEDMEPLDDEPDELLNDDGLPKGRRGFNMIDQQAEPITFNSEERARFINQIAELRQRLDRYEPEGGPAALSIAAARPKNRLPSPAVDLAKLRLQLSHAQAELRVAEDAIREHIRQKARLREQIDQAQHQGKSFQVPADTLCAHTVSVSLRASLDSLPAQLERLARAAITGALAEVTDAGRGRRARGVGDGVAVAHPAPAHVAVSAPLAEVRTPAPAAVVETRPAAVAADRGPVERPVSVQPTPVAPAAADAPVKWGPRGEPKIARGLRELGEATVEMLAAHLGISKQAVSMNLSNHAAHIDSRQLLGRGCRKAYRLKA